MTKLVTSNRNRNFKPAFLFIDVAKTYDRIGWFPLVNKMNQLGYQLNIIIQIKRSFLADRKIPVRIRHEYSGPQDTHTHTSDMCMSVSEDRNNAILADDTHRYRNANTYFNFDDQVTIFR